MEDTESDVTTEEPAGDSTPPSGGGGGEADGLLSRYQQAGIDLRSVDPGQLSQAMQFHQRYGQHEKLYTPQDVAEAAKQHLTQALQNPQARAQLAQYLGIVSGNGGGEEDADPSETRYKKLEQGIGLLAQMVHQMHQQSQGALKQTESKQTLDRLEANFDKAMGEVQGAKEHRRLTRLFWAGVQAGEIPPNANVNQLRKWVESEVREWGGKPGKPKPPPRIDAPTGSKIAFKKDATEDDVVNQITDMFGLS